MGRIINLPEDLICHIISFLSAKEATCFKYSSKKWLNLVTIIPNLVFDSDISANFKDFVDGLSLARHATYRIRRFSLKLRSTDLVNDFLLNVLEHGVLDLELYINVKGNYSLPSEVFTCNSVVELKLGSGFVIDMIPNNALLPALKTLLLDSVRFYDTGSCAFQRLVSACPVLEELVIDGLNWEHWKWSHTVSSLTLKRLTIRREEWEDYEGSEYETLSFNTPSLVYLEYADVLLDEYPVVNLNSLVEAKLELLMMYGDNDYDLTNLIKGLQNVQILRSDFVDTMELFYVFSEAVPVFDKLFHLSVITEEDFCWQGLQVLLKNSPKLKTLTIEGSLHYDPVDMESVCECLLGYSFLVSCPIEILNITEFIGEFGEIVQMKHVLGNLPGLVLLEVHVQAMLVPGLAPYLRPDPNQDQLP